jgi:archaellum component FlaG (FlaF/FlaG flagellin family)
MADGGATSMIMLITALIISSMASVVLINSWAGIADVMDEQGRKAEADSATKVSLAGDTMNVDYVIGDKEITLYFQNSGTSTLDKDKANMAIYVAGVALSIQGTPSVVSGAAEWYEGELLEVVGRHTGTAHANDDEVIISLTVRSLPVNGMIGGDTLNEVVRLDV